MVTQDSEIFNMNSDGHTRRKRRLPYGEAPFEKHQTICDEQVSFMLNKQLNTQTSLQSELARSSAFTSGFHVTHQLHSKEGKLSLHEFKRITEEEEYKQMLVEYGLNENEIELKLKSNSKIELLDKTESNLLKQIEKKIEKHKKDLQKKTQYSNARQVTRMEYDINNAQYHGTENSREANFLVEVKSKVFPENDPVMATLRECSKKQNSRTMLDEESESDCEPSFVGPLLSDVNTRVKVIPKEEICKNKISIDEMLEIEKFKNYKIGDRSKVLYIKNLAKNTTDKDLAKLFAHFYDKDSYNFVSYKVMSGRMRGQAFVTFSDEEIANQALHLCNGYKINGRPIIISFGRGDVT